MKEVMIDLRKYDLSNKLGLDMISVDALLNELEDALCEIESLKEEIEDLKQDREDNYRPLTYKEMGWE